MTEDDRAADRERVRQERWQLLHHLDALTDVPMTLLSLVWLVLLIIDFTGGLSPALQLVSNVIWALFVADFGLGLLIAPDKLAYVGRRWLTALALLLPALRVLRMFRAFRILRAARAVRSVGLVRLLTTINRGVGALALTFGRRGIGFVLGLTLIVTLAGAAGMAYFENPAAPGEAGAGLRGYGEALWWTAMVMVTMGTDYWPKTAEGRVLAWLLALYAFTIFGYITATIASHFIGQDAGSPTPATDLATLGAELAAVRGELAALRADLGLAPPAPLASAVPPSTTETEGLDR